MFQEMIRESQNGTLDLGDDEDDAAASAKGKKTDTKSKNPFIKLMHQLGGTYTFCTCKQDNSRPFDLGLRCVCSPFA